MGIESFFQKLPGVAKPLTRLTFKDKMKWTGIILVLYYALGAIPVWGISTVGLARFKEIEGLFGAAFGSLITLGIGPIVTASIIMQLLVGSKIINWDLSTHHGKVMFQGTQKIFALVFTVVEALAYTLFGAVSPVSWTWEVLGAIIFQLALGGWLILFMDEVVSKWGIGSGVSLFIAASVSKQIFISAFNFQEVIGQFHAGRVIGLIESFIQGIPQWSYALPIISTIAVFVLVIYAQAMRVEIPLAFGSLRGFGRKWPLRFIYTSNIPVILAASLLISLRAVGSIAAQRGATWFAQIDQQGNIVGGLVQFFIPPHSVPIQVFSLTLGVAVIAGLLIAYYVLRERVLEVVAGFGVMGAIAGVFLMSTYYGMPLQIDVVRAITYTVFFILGSVMFALFWVETSGMDARSIANQIQKAGLQIPGFRRDPRVIEQVLNRYIPPLTILGGAFVGFLAAFADFTGALAAGTSILLTVMIVYQLYEQIAYQHLEDMHPMLRKFVERA